MVCTNKEIITEVYLVTVIPPAINHCKRLTIEDCQLQINGDLFICMLKISKQLSLYTDQTNVLTDWQTKSN